MYYQYKINAVFPKAKILLKIKLILSFLTKSLETGVWTLPERFQFYIITF